MIQAYIEAFNRCYPHKTIEVKPKRVRGEVRYRVIIDQDPGDLMLSADDLKDATRAFNRGRAV